MKTKEIATVTLDADVFMEVFKTLERLEEMADMKANVGYLGRYSVEDTWALTVTCMTSYAKHHLKGYLSAEDEAKLFGRRGANDDN